MVKNDFLRAAESVRDISDNIRTRLDEDVETSMNHVARKVQNEAERLDADATGTLQSELGFYEQPKYVPANESRNTKGTYLGGYKVAVPGFYKYLEYGSGTGSKFVAPSPAPPLVRDGAHGGEYGILDWIFAKGIEPREYDSVYSLAAAIQASIARTGTASKPFMRNGWYRSEDAIRDNMQRSFKYYVKMPFRGFSRGGY